MRDEHITVTMPPAWLSWVVGFACLAAVFDMPYGYYQLLRLIVTGYAAYISYAYFRGGNSAIAWLFAFFALIYNPIFPIAMTKGVHGVFNVLTFMGIVFEQYVTRRREDHAPESAAAHQPLTPDDRVDLTKFLAREIVIIAAVIALVFTGMFLWDGSAMRQDLSSEDFSVAPPED
mgnify:CR=1 FL=1